MKATTIDDYINQLPEDRKTVVEKIRNILKTNLPVGFSEQLSHNMIGFVVPKSVYPNGYHANTDLPLPFINLASQKNYIALYHMGIYANKKLLDWFIKEYPKHCKRKLDMGKSCIRFKDINDIPYQLIEELATKMSVKEWIKIYETAIKR